MLAYSKDDIEKIRHLIAEGANQEAINALYPILGHDVELKDTVLLLKNRLAVLNKAVREGTITKEEENVERNTINRNLLDILTGLESDMENKHDSSAAPVPEPVKTPEETRTHRIPDKHEGPKKPKSPPPVLIRGLLALATILITVLIERSINGWLEGRNASPDKSLIVRLALQPDYPGIRQAGLAKVAIGKFTSLPQPIPPEGMLHVTNIPAEFAEDSVKLELHEVKFPCRVTGQSAPNLEKSNDITFYLELATVTYQGKIVDRNSRPIPNAEVDVESGLARTIADANGDYTLTLPVLDKEIILVTVRLRGKVLQSLPMGLNPDVLKEITVRTE